MRMRRTIGMGYGRWQMSHPNGPPYLPYSIPVVLRILISHPNGPPHLPYSIPVVLRILISHPSNYHICLILLESSISHILFIFSCFLSSKIHPEPSTCTHGVYLAYESQNVQTLYICVIKVTGKYIYYRELNEL